ncbi:MAG: hypothetical protein AAF970_12370 [Bacteroidota bacterium]
MTATYASSLVLLLLSVLGSPGSQTVSSNALGVSMELPASWTRIATNEHTRNLPRFGIYYVMNAENSRVITIDRQECGELREEGTWDQDDWVSGQYITRDEITPLGRHEAPRLNDYEGFVGLQKREVSSQKTVIPIHSKYFMAYVYHVIEGDHCYTVSMSALEWEFEESRSDFELIAGSLRFFATD